MVCCLNLISGELFFFTDSGTCPRVFRTFCEIVGCPFFNILLLISRLLGLATLLNLVYKLLKLQIDSATFFVLTVLNTYFSLFVLPFLYLALCLLLLYILL